MFELDLKYTTNASLTDDGVKNLINIELFSAGAFNGPIPQSIYQLESIQIFELNDAQYNDGTFPDCNWPNITEFIISLLMGVTTFIFLSIPSFVIGIN